MTSRSVRPLLAPFFALTFLLPLAFGQGSSKRMLPAPADENDQDQPRKRAEWNMRGRIAPKGESAAALRLRAHQQKMAMRAARAVEARTSGAGFGNAPQAATWVNLGPSPLASDATGTGFQDYNWVSGRATSVLIDPADTTGNTVLLGGAYGGLWRSTNAGNKSATPDLVSWQPLIDDQPTLAVGAIALEPTNSNVILVGTGETNSSGDSYYGLGILRSTDGGSTWTQVTSAQTGQSFLGVGFSKIAFSTANPNLVVASTAGDIGLERGLEQDGFSTARGLYFSIDAGATWNRVILSDSAVPASVTGVVYNRNQGANGTFYAAVRRHGLYSSTDGQHFTRLNTQPIPGLASANCPANSNSVTCQIYRSEFAVTPGSPDMYVWIVDIVNGLEVDRGIWRTSNGGTGWTQISETGITHCGDSFFGPDSGCGVQQGAYNLELAAIPNGTNGTSTDLYAGTINIYKCTLASGGTSCTQGSWLNLTHVYGCQNIALGAPAHVHPDQHGLAFMVAGTTAPGYFAHDGGISRTLDGYAGLTTGSCTGHNQFDSLSQTLGSISEFVSFSVHPTSADDMLGGTQDNGSPKTATGTTSTIWQNALSGDGGFNAINPNNGNEWFASNPGSIIGICEAGTGCDDNSFFLLAAPAPILGNIDAGAFYTPYILDPQNTGEMLIGTCRVWRGATATGIFSTLSVNFDTLAASTCTGLEINQVASLAAGGPKDANNNSKVVYATTNGFGPLVGPINGILGGEVWVTTTGAQPMTNVTGGINPNHYPISSVTIDNNDSTGQTAYVGIMGFHTSHVWQTKNAGTSWTDWTGSGPTALPDAPVDALLVDSQAQLIYAGTDAGIFVSPTTGTSASWTEVGPAPGPGVTGFLPNAPVTAIQIFNNGVVKRLRVSTYGRGIWEFPLTVPPPDFSWAGGGSHQVLSGQTTPNYTFTATPVGGTFVNNVTFACTNLPALTSCTFSPASISALTVGTQTVTMTISTTGPNPQVGNLNRRADRRDADHRSPWLPLTVPIAGMVVIGVAGRRIRRQHAISVLCVSLALMGLLLACGGGSSSPPPPPPQISVTVALKAGQPSSLFPNNAGWPVQTAQFMATVNNSSNQNVTWAVVGSPANGTIDANGVYTAPTVAPGLPPSATITATAQADTTKSGSAKETLNPATLPGTYSNIGVTATDNTVTISTPVELIVN